MPIIPFFIANSFTLARFDGNPAGVFLDETGELTHEQMKKLAGEIHLESAFVSPPETPDADFRFRYFTGLTEVPLCGHATVAAFAALTQSGRIVWEMAETMRPFRLQIGVGILRVEVLRGGKGEAEQITLFQAAPTFGVPLPGEQAVRLWRAVGAAGSDAPENLPVQAVSTGTPWLFVPVKTRALVDNAPADLAAIEQISHQTQTWGVFVFAVEKGLAGLTTWGRCFAPRAGLSEDPVTGSASGALGAYLAQHGVLPVAPKEAKRFTGLQGFAGGRGGIVQITVTRSAGGDLGASITGEALVLGEGIFRV